MKNKFSQIIIQQPLPKIIAGDSKHRAFWEDPECRFAVITFEVLKQFYPKFETLETNSEFRFLNIPLRVVQVDDPNNLIIVERAANV